jgi:tRNA A37 threonylcarbamoyladenosine modification protein TsaB
VQNAGRGEIATALYQLQNGNWQRLIVEHITTVEELCAKIATKTIFCGRFSPDIARQIEERLGNRAIILKGLRRAGSLAELGWRRLKMGETDNPATLQPLYLRPPSVTTKSRKEIKR